MKMENGTSESKNHHNEERDRIPSLHHHRKWPIHSPKAPHFVDDPWPSEITQSMRLREISLHDDEEKGLEPICCTLSGSLTPQKNKVAPDPAREPRHASIVGKSPGSIDSGLGAIKEDGPPIDPGHAHSPCCSFGQLRDVSGSMPSIWEDKEGVAAEFQEQPMIVSDGTQTYFASDSSGRRRTWTSEDNIKPEIEEEEGTIIIYQSPTAIKDPRKLSIKKAFGRKIPTKKFQAVELPRIILERKEDENIKRYLIPGKHSYSARWMFFGTIIYDYLGHAFIEQVASSALLSCCVCLSTESRPKSDYFKCRDCNYVCHVLCTEEVEMPCPVSSITSLEMAFPYDNPPDYNKN